MTESLKFKVSKEEVEGKGHRKSKQNKGRDQPNAIRYSALNQR